MPRLKYRVQKREFIEHKVCAYRGRTAMYGPWRTLFNANTLDEAREYANKRRYVGLGEWRILLGRAKCDLT